MIFDERTIARGLDDLAVRWNSKYEKFQSAPVPQNKRDWLYVASSAPSTPVSVKIAPETLETPPKPVLGLYAIRAAVMKVCQLNDNEFNSDRRSHYIVKPRQCFYYLCKKHTNQSFPAIGQRAGRKDHSTVIHGVRKIDALVKSGDAKTIALIDAIELALGV